MNPTWSIVLTAFSLATAYMTGTWPIRGWYMGLATQVVWAVYAVSTDQVAFLATVVLFTVIYIRNIRRWRRKPVPAPAAQPCSCRA